MEPLLDKYLSNSPYEYSLLNPLKIVDVNGRDGKVTINGTSIILDIDLHFSLSSQENSQGLVDQQINLLAEFQMNVEDYYSGIFQIDGTEYNVTTNFNLILDLDYASAVYQKILDPGSNVIENLGENNPILSENPEHRGVGVTGGFDLVLSSGKELNPYKDTGGHEVAHLLGLKDKGYNNNSIAGYLHPRQKPTGKDFEEIFKKSNIDLKSKKTQLIKGHNEE